MQASKIRVGDGYAIEHRGKLALLHVKSVTTTRTGIHPSDFKHRITGMVDGEELTVGPDAVLGPYREHAELVKQREAAKAAREAEERAAIERANALARHLYRLMELPLPDELSSYSLPVRVAYGSKVDLNDDGVRRLLVALEALRLKVAAS